MARAIVVEPDVLLMDEPLSNLDALLRVRMRSELKKLQRSIGVTTIYVTHDQVEAMTMGDRVAVMNRGRIEQVGTPDEVYEHPANMFVAGFIGSPQMNFVPARVALRGGRPVLEAEGFTLPPPPGLEEKLRGMAGEEVVAGVRPEHLSVNPPGGGGGVERLRGVVDFVERLGSDTILHVRVGGHVLVAKLPGGARFEVGEEVVLGVPAARVHVFRATGEALR